jgi:hypothetical protein
VVYREAVLGEVLSDHSGQPGIVFDHQQMIAHASSLFLCLLQPMARA